VAGGDGAGDAAAVAAAAWCKRCRGILARGGGGSGSAVGGRPRGEDSGIVEEKAGDGVS